MKSCFTLGLRSWPIHGVSHDWMTNFCHVNANLVRTPSFQPASHEARHSSETLEHSIMRHRTPTSVRSPGYTSPQVATISHQRNVDHSRLTRRQAFNHS